MSSPRRWQLSERCWYGFPILAPVLFSAAFLVQAHVFRFDYLMPAEIFPWP